MAYSLQSELERAAGGYERLVQLCDRNGTGELDAAAIVVMTEAIVEADGWIDTFLQKVIATPLAAPSKRIRKMSAREAIYQLREDKGVNEPDDHERHAERERWLTLVAKGVVGVGDDPAPAKSTEVVPEVLVQDDDDLSRDRDSYKGFT